MLLLELLQPRLDKYGFLLLGFGDRSGRELGGRLVGEQAVLVPVVHGFIDQDVGFRGCGLAFREADSVDAGCTPGIPLAVDPGEARVAQFETAVFVDGFGVGGLGDVERVAADH
ncbi:hypothetical protein RRF57_011770 [Xylaria bambusicola]|uniref:Uncharacterized protein n=1 Tax=Xylaria bambusicola TaxID=326684 RepID=A0AAN7UVF2_9PEZI